MRSVRPNEILVSVLIAILLCMTLDRVRETAALQTGAIRRQSGTVEGDRPDSAARRHTDRTPTNPPSHHRPHEQRIRTDIHFAGRRFPANANAADELRTFCRNLLPHESAPALVGMPEIPSPRERRRLAQAGLELTAYVADGGWVARIQGRAASLDIRVSAFVPITPDLRIAPSLAAPSACRDVPVYIHLVDGAEADDLLHKLRDAGVGALTANRHGPFTTIAGTVPTNRIAVLNRIAGQSADVQYAQQGSGARLLNSASVGILQSATPNGPTPFWDAGIYGSNQVIAVCDTGLDVDMTFFRDPSGALPPSNRVHESTVNTNLRKVIAADFLYMGDNPANVRHWDNQGHGTFVCGCAAGSDINAPFSTTACNGMAPGAKLIVQDGGYATDDCADLPGLGCPVTNFYPALVQAIRQGAVIHNNSWGDNENGTLGPRNAYSPCSRELDLVAWSNRQFLVVCAAGNDGSRGNDVVASPSNAKNALSVAACNPGGSLESIAGFSSRGWSDDGRIKPDLAAPGGYRIRSAASDKDITTNNGSTKTGAGTSYASPMIAGMAAVVRDYFRQGFHPTRTATPCNSLPHVSAALVKAVLINSAQNMTGTATTPPARDQGWGRVNLSNTLPVGGSVRNLLVIDSPPAFDATNAAPFEVTLDVTSTNHPLKVTLVWTDYPSTPGAGKHLVNDLDLTVTTPGATYSGNVFDNGWSVAGGTTDRVNNVEQVAWLPDATGHVQITVAPFVIPQPTQDFALVVSGDFAAAPAGQDSYADGLPDVWELANFPDLYRNVTGDADKDGASNRDELAAGTDPTEPTDRLRFTHVSGQFTPPRTVLAWAAVTNRTYALAWRSNLSEGTWLPLVSNVPAPTDRATVTLDTHTVRGAYYRVRVEGNDAAP